MKKYIFTILFILIFSLVLYLILNFNKNKSATDISELELTYDNSFYTDHIEIIFNKNCIVCHQDNKKKGGLNMISPNKIKMGGNNGSVLIIGNAYKSEIYKRIILPVSEKKHMPKGKPALSNYEIKLIKWWINSGASFSKKIKEYILPERIKIILDVKI